MSHGTRENAVGRAAGASRSADADVAAPLDGERHFGMGQTLRTSYAVFWLVFLVEPIVSEVQRGNLTGAVCLLAFATFYAGVWIVGGRGMWRATSAPGGFSPAVSRFILVTSLGFAVASPILAGQSGTGVWIYVAVVLAARAPRRWVIAAAAAFVALNEMLSRVLPAWEPDTYLSVALLFAAGMTLFGRLSVIRRIELERSRVENARMALVDERNRMARDVHDILGHSLTVITVKAELVGRLLESDQPNALARARAEAADVERLAREALADVRRTVEGYREMSLAAELAAARLALQAADIDARLPGSGECVDQELSDLFAWAVREGVTNVVRHSSARHVRITLTPDSVSVADDGHGVAGMSAPGGEGAEHGQQGGGLRGLTERAVKVGATVTTGRSDLGGFLLEVRG